MTESTKNSKTQSKSYWRIARWSLAARPTTRHGSHVIGDGLRAGLSPRNRPVISKNCANLGTGGANILRRKFVLGHAVVLLFAPACAHAHVTGFSARQLRTRSRG